MEFCIIGDIEVGYSIKGRFSEIRKASFFMKGARLLNNSLLRI